MSLQPANLAPLGCRLSGRLGWRLTAPKKIAGVGNGSRFYLVIVRSRHELASEPIQSQRGVDAAGSEASQATKLIEQISTGRIVPNSLTEKLAMEEVTSNPAGTVIERITMSDPRFPAADGWVKMQQKVNGVGIHYIQNLNTGAVADFKFIGP
jgi:hypothetical protein